MAITRAQQARQMYKEGSKPVKQAGVKNFLGKQEMVKAPKFWLSEPGHVKAKLAYITDEEEKILIDKNLYGSLKGKPNKGPAGLPSLQGGDFGAGGGSGSAAGDSDGPTGRDRHMGLQGKTGKTDKSLSGGGVDRSKVSQFSTFGRNVMARNLTPSFGDRIGNLISKSPTIRGIKFVGGLFNQVFGPKGPTNIDPYSGGRTGLHAETTNTDDDNTGGGNDRPLYAQLGYPSQEAYLAAMQLARGSAGLPAAVQPAQTMDLNRIAYRLMADGGFLGDEDERQAYGLGSIVRKITRPIKKVVKKATSAVKKVTKSPLGRLALAVAAPYALGPAMAQSQFLMGLSAAQKAALISGATTGITQLASGEDLDLKDIALSAALSGGISKFTAPKGIDGKAFNAARTSAGQAPGIDRQAFSAARLSGSRALDPSSIAGQARVAGDQILASTMTPEKTSLFSSLGDSLKNIGGKGLDFAKDNKLLTLAGVSGLAGLMAKQQEQEELEELDRGEGIDIEAIRRRPFDFMAPRFAGSQFDFYAAEGGQAKKEPVAKKVMPLLDMGGMEKDYRAEGGFVPIGRMEKADDVPARLSKNEFVFTADAVRNAGDGNVDKGAEVMYNMMKNLESGGDVSEESQGLEGARKMFQTSQRLEEVL